MGITAKNYQIKMKRHYSLLSMLWFAMEFFIELDSVFHLCFFFVCVCVVLLINRKEKNPPRISISTEIGHLAQINDRLCFTKLFNAYAYDSWREKQINRQIK